MQDIVLINGYRVDFPILPTGLGYVAQALENAGFGYEICDVNIQTHNQIIDIVDDIKPQYVGLGTMSYDIEKNYSLLKSIHESVPNVTIILGGPHAIAAGKDIFNDCSIIDVVIKGEAEKAIVSLLNGEQLVPGVIKRDLVDEAVPLEQLDIKNIDFPKYNKFDLEKYGNTINLASSRGCVYKCTFCGAPKFLGKKWRAFSAQNMIGEFEYWYSNGYRDFYFSDSLFSAKKQRVIDFCNHIIESDYKDVTFSADGVRCDNLSLEVLQYMRKANFNNLTFGVESIHDKTLKFFEKGETFDTIDNIISIADSLGFKISIYLIIGAAGETLDEVIESLNYPMKYKYISNSIVSKLVPIRGTSYYEYAMEHGLIDEEKPYYPAQEVHSFNNTTNINNDRVQEIWDGAYPTIYKMKIFINMRNQIRDKLCELNINNINVRILNVLTNIRLNKSVDLYMNIINRISKRIKQELKIQFA